MKTKKFVFLAIASLLIGVNGALAFYNPNMGRWLNKDPIGEPGGFNLYSFAANNPNDRIDLLGLALYAFDGTGMTYRDQSHVGILYSIYNGNKWYEKGVGSTWDGPLDNPWVGGFAGSGGATRLESMYQKFLEYYGGGDHDIDIIGFSRGSALAREFANMLYERGYETTESWSGIGRRGRKTDKCPVKIRFVGLFDTVGSFGIPGNHIDFGIRMNLPPNVEHAAQALAQDEKRALFPVTRLNAAGPGQAFNEQVFPGDHSDIGGGWGADQNLLSWAPLFYIWEQGRSAGVPFGVLPYRTLVDSYIPHDNRGIGHAAATVLMYDTSPVTILLNGGIKWPTEPRSY
jgi:uncharacterized protein (DUF2235 family)